MAGGGSASAGAGAAGVSTGAGTRVDVTLKLSQLQNLCKRDPDGYKSDYEAQIRRLESELGILALSPSTAPSPSLMELIQFAAAVSSSSYKGTESNRIANLLIGLLVGSSSSSSNISTTTTTKPGSVQSVANVCIMPAAALQLHRDVRKSCVSALILMRNKGALEPLRLLELFFRIMAVIPDKGLREQLYKHMVNDIRNINKTKKDETVNRAIQTFLHRVVSTHGSAPSVGGSRAGDSNAAAGAGADTMSLGSSSVYTSNNDAATDVAAKRATDLVCEMYRRMVWTDDRTVAILASAVDSKNTTVMSRAIRFFLNIEEKMADDAKEKEDGDWDERNRIDFHKFSKKTKSRERHVEKQKTAKKKAQEKRQKTKTGDWMDDDPSLDRGVEHAKKLYPAIELLRDPQGLAESLLKKLRSTGTFRYETKLLMMNFVTRLVGNHQLLVLPLYSFMTKYLTSHQKDVTAVLAYAVQACHEHVPPDEVYLLLQTIAHNFITERCSEEEMAVGINAARAICARVPSVMSEEESKETGGTACLDIEAFARDLAAFANHRDRSVSTAGKTWVNFVREVHPGLLKGKDRGLKGTALYRSGAKPTRYGESKAASGVEGSDLLAFYEARKAVKKLNQQRLAENGEEDEEEEDDDNDGWVDVDSDEEEEGDHKDAKAKKQQGEWEEVEEDSEDGWVDVDSDEEGGENDEGEWEEDEEGEDNQDGAGEEEEEEEVDDDDSAPDLVALDKNNKSKLTLFDLEKLPDISKLSQSQRDKLKQQISANRIFSAEDFEKMRKLLEREHKLKTDPREAARRKRAIARGEDPDELSDDSSDSDDSEKDKVRVHGAVNPSDIQAFVKRKRQSKADKLETVLAGREAFETKGRSGGATNIEKKRTKNFLMSKYSSEARVKGTKKSGFKKRKWKALTHEAKKRRRKL